MEVSRLNRHELGKAPIQRLTNGLFSYILNARFKGPANPANLHETTSAVTKRPATSPSRRMFNKVFFAECAPARHNAMQELKDLPFSRCASTSKDEKIPQPLQGFAKSSSKIKVKSGPAEPVRNRPECRWHPGKEKGKRVENCLRRNFNRVVRASARMHRDPADAVAFEALESLFNFQVDHRHGAHTGDNTHPKRPIKERESVDPSILPPLARNVAALESTL